MLVHIINMRLKSEITFYKRRYSNLFQNFFLSKTQKLLSVELKHELMFYFKIVY